MTRRDEEKVRGSASAIREVQSTVQRRVVAPVVAQVITTSARHRCVVAPAQTPTPTPQLYRLASTAQRRLLVVSFRFRRRVAAILGRRDVTSGRQGSLRASDVTQRRRLASISCKHNIRVGLGLGFTIRYDTRCYFNVRSKANMSQLNLQH